MSPWGLGECAEATDSSAWARVCGSPGLSMQVSAVLRVCVWRISAPTCVCWGGQWLCVSLSVPVSELPVVSVYVCVGVCIAGLWQCMVLSLVISEHLCGAAVCTVSLCVHQRL